MTGAHLLRWPDWEYSEEVTGLCSGIISSVITFSEFKSFVNNPGNYDSLSGAVVSTFTGIATFSPEFRSHNLLFS